MQSLRYNNFNFIQTELIDETLFYDICQHDYYIIASDFLNDNKIDVNLQYGRNEYSKLRIWYSINIDLEPAKFRCSKTTLYREIEKENIEIVKLLLSCDNINLNKICKYVTCGDDWLVEKTPLF